MLSIKNLLVFATAVNMFCHPSNVLVILLPIPATASAESATFDSPLAKSPSTCKESEFIIPVVGS